MKPTSPYCNFSTLLENGVKCKKLYCVPLTNLHGTEKERYGGSEELVVWSHMRKLNSNSLKW